jgi:pimeloyl-ACP methyl ester carboxylesterase
LTLRIERISGRRTNRIRLSGEFRAGQIDQVKAELQSAGSSAVLDLAELGLVDVECVHFLNRCEMEGISMFHRSPYIKEWMLRERTAKERKDIMKSTSAESKPAIVFCHGLWADGSCFSKLIVPLQAEGYECIAAQYGLNTTAEDVALVKATMGRVRSPVILVGHSYGGTVITGAGTDDRVVGLVYICALAPDADETSQTQQSRFPRTDVFSHIEVVDGRIWLRPEGTKYFCGDLSEQEQKLVWATQGVPQPDLFDAKAGGTAWKSKPSWYIVGKNDQTVHPDLERAMAKRMGATTYELDSSHVPMLSQPERVIDIIRAAAKGVQASKAKA